MSQPASPAPMSEPTEQEDLSGPPDDGTARNGTLSIREGE
jgi:hypothetical protein